MINAKTCFESLSTSGLRVHQIRVFPLTLSLSKGALRENRQTLMTREESELTKLFVVNHQMPYLGPSNLRIVFERLYNWYLVRTAAKTVR